MSKEKSSMELWAEREVQIACERERNGAPGNEWNYGVACYESALKAFKSLLEDEHSGMSFDITMSILNALAKGQPLTPIEDTDDIWNECGRYPYEKDYITYQCKRMSSLFKKVYDDGRIEYYDVDRFTCVYKDNPDIPWHNGHVDKIAGDIFPITMPYVPKIYTVVCEEHLTNRKNGDFDTLAILYVYDKDGNRKYINRYFDEDGEGWREIDNNEWCERVKKHKLRVRLEELKALGYEVLFKDDGDYLVITVKKDSVLYFARLSSYTKNRTDVIIENIDHCVRYVDKDLNVKEVSE